MTKKRDSITVLTSKGPLLTKTWALDGTINGHGRAKQHKVTAVAVDNIFDVAALFETLRSKPRSCVVRGEYLGHPAASRLPDPDFEREAGYALRQAIYFTDPPRHWFECDVDGYVPLLFDPVLEPVESIREWIKYHLPPAFQEITFYWQLSSSAGHPTKEGTLRCHIFFWLVRPFNSPEAAAWVTLAKVPVDRAPLNVVQAAYTADPVFAEGVVDPVPLRAGLVQGLFGDVVNLVVDEGALAVAVVNGRTYAPTGELIDRNDPRLKRGLIGAFCRAFSPEDVLTADWFTGNFERVNERRWTWIDGHGAPEGCYITDDRLALVNTHNSAPDNTIGKGQNAYDVARLYMFDERDQAVPEDDRWTWQADPMSRPSDVAMRAFARTLPEVVAAMETAAVADFTGDTATPVGSPPAAGAPDNVVDTVVDTAAGAALSDKWGAVTAKKIQGVLHHMGVTDEEIKALIDKNVLLTSWRGCFYSSSKSRLILMNREGEMVSFTKEDWQSMIAATFGKMLVPAVLDTVAQRLGEQTTTPAAKVAEALRDAVWARFIAGVKLYRQREEIRYAVDMYASESRVMLTQTAAAVTYRHVPFKARHSGATPEVEAAIVAEYRAHFPFFDTMLDMLLHARFAADRRNAFLHMQCAASWGKGFLFDGILGRDGLGLVAEMNVKDVERCFSGDPVSIQASDVVRAWALFFDEFKMVKGEIKMLNSGLMAAPKNQLRFWVAVYCKFFASAEDVDSLAGAEGIEQQFADRFAMLKIADGAPGIEDCALFQEHGKLVYRIACQNYAAQVLNAGVERMVAMGPAAAAKCGDDWLKAFHTDYGISKDRPLLSDNLEGYADEVRQLILDWAASTVGRGKTPQIEHMPSALKGALAQSVSVVKGARAKGDDEALLVLVKRPVGLIKQWVKYTMDHSSIALVGHKSRLIGDRIAGTDSNKTVRYYAGGLPRIVKGLLLTLATADELAEAAETFSNVVPFASKADR